MTKRYKKRTAATSVPSGMPHRRTHERVVAYGRQSTLAQVGNVSTLMQTEDLPRFLQSCGWSPNHIIEITLDGGVSGQTPMAERPGMSQLVAMIEAGEVGTVAVVDEDRLFRDTTQIEPNRFIELCRQHRVDVLTPTTHYVFHGGLMGANHSKLFRQKAEHAADYITYHLKQRLHPARARLERKGVWAGTSTPVGYMLDLRSHLPDGTENPQHRKLVRFAPHADVLLAQFELYRTYNGNMQRTWRHLDEQGPVFPDVPPGQVPPGHRLILQLKRRSRGVPGYLPAYNTLRYIFTNVVYLGHWVYQDEVVQWHNHEALIPEALFMFAFNRISRTDFYGNPNPHYCPQNPRVRHDRPDRRLVAPPTYAGLITSDDLPGHPGRQLTAVWDNNHAIGRYRYVLRGAEFTDKNRWIIVSEPVDASIDQLLVDKLRTTQHDAAAWQQAYAQVSAGESADQRVVRRQLRDAMTAQEQALTNYKAATHEGLRARLEADYAAGEERVAALRRQEAALAAKQASQRDLKDAQTALATLLDSWGRVSAGHKRQLAELLMRGITMSQQGRTCKRVVVTWVDESQSEGLVWGARGRKWTATDRETCRELIESGAPQVQILRALPEYTWRNIKDQYAYYFNNGSREGIYNGEQPYTQGTRWQDTEEYRAEQGGGTAASSSPSTTVGTDRVSSLPVELLTRLPGILAA